MDAILIAINRITAPLKRLERQLGRTNQLLRVQQNALKQTIKMGATVSALDTNIQKLNNSFRAIPTVFSMVFRKMDNMMDAMRLFAVSFSFTSEISVSVNPSVTVAGGGFGGSSGTINHPSTIPVSNTDNANSIDSLKTVIESLTITIKNMPDDIVKKIEASKDPIQEQWNKVGLWSTLLGVNLNQVLAAIGVHPVGRAAVITGGGLYLAANSEYAQKKSKERMERNQQLLRTPEGAEILKRVVHGESRSDAGKILSGLQADGSTYSSYLGGYTRLPDPSYARIKSISEMSHSELLERHKEKTDPNYVRPQPKGLSAEALASQEKFKEWEFQRNIAINKNGGKEYLEAGHEQFGGFFRGSFESLGKDEIEKLFQKINGKDVFSKKAPVVRSVESYTETVTPAHKQVVTAYGGLIDIPQEPSIVYKERVKYKQQVLLPTFALEPLPETTNKINQNNLFKPLSTPMLKNSMAMPYLTESLSTNMINNQPTQGRGGIMTTPMLSPQPQMINHTETHNITINATTKEHSPAEIAQMVTQAISRINLFPNNANQSLVGDII